MDNLRLGVAVAKIDYQQVNNMEQIILPEPKFYKELSVHGQQYNIDVYVFSSYELSQEDAALFGYRYTGQGWKRQLVPFPDIVYDRCFFTSSKERLRMEAALAFISHRKNFQYINNQLPSKLQVYKQLNTEEALIPYLPHTDSVDSISEITQWLQLYPQGIVLKPAAGMHGKGIVHIHYDEQQRIYQVNGRNHRNESFQASFSRELSLLKWLYKFKKQNLYVIQPYFYLRNDNEQPFDIRVLMQKDDLGRWQQTGIMARIGDQQGLTSNLHGGGEATFPYPILSQNLGSYKAERLLQEIHIISGQTATAIEAHFGRFGELAFDFGVTPQGRLWLLECNSKPGRQAFSQTLTDDIANLAIQRPLQYALFLSKRNRYRQHAVM